MKVLIQCELIHTLISLPPSAFTSLLQETACLKEACIHVISEIFITVLTQLSKFQCFLLYYKSKAKFKFRNAQGITSLRNKHSVNSSLVYKWSILFCVIQWVVLWTQSLPEVPSEHWYHQPPVWTQWGPVWCSIPRSWPWLWLAHFCKVIHENSTHVCYNSKDPIATHLDCKTFKQLYFADLIATLQHIYQGCDSSVRISVFSGLWRTTHVIRVDPSCCCCVFI